MVFGALLEFAMVNYITHFRVLVKKKRLSAFEDVDNNAGDAGKEQEKQRRHLIQEMESKMVTRALMKAKRVDLFARVLFPLIFVVFNLAYWGHYLNFYYGLVDEFKTGLNKLSN